MNFEYNSNAGRAPAGQPVHVDDQTGASAKTNLSPEGLLERASKRFWKDYAKIFQEVGRNFALRICDEDARRRVLSPNLVTTPNAQRISTLETQIFRNTEKMQPMLETLMELFATNEIARRQVHIFKAAERKSVKSVQKRRPAIFRSIPMLLSTISTLIMASTVEHSHA